MARVSDTGRMPPPNPIEPWKPEVENVREPVTRPRSMPPDIDDIPPELRGLHPNNPVNRVRDGGTQLELSARVRGLSPRSPLPGADGLSPVTTELVQGLAAAARSW